MSGERIVRPLRGPTSAPKAIAIVLVSVAAVLAVCLATKPGDALNAAIWTAYLAVGYGSVWSGLLYVHSPR